jgi:molybdopterin converting factor subunit 1
MRVAVLFYARLAELAGRREWTLDVPAGATAGDVWRACLERYGALEPMTGRVSCAINAEFASMTTAVGDGDEVAFLPPVSGGGETR